MRERVHAPMSIWWGLFLQLACGSSAGSRTVTLAGYSAFVIIIIIIIMTSL
jgi:hypothetical protein